VLTGSCGNGASLTLTIAHPAADHAEGHPASGQLKLQTVPSEKRPSALVEAALVL
jgi:hypothetical protein